MRNDLILKMDLNKDMFLFLRENPSFHRALSYNPFLFKEFEEEYKTKRRKHLSDRIEDLSMMVALAKELI